ncbi:MAG: polysaccharide deacetylase family protein [Armatimonadetes bacterium]|nr:polysaccharide deacetylase family protein [Armatimonadota bacterium]
MQPPPDLDAAPAPPARAPARPQPKPAKPAVAPQSPAPPAVPERKPGVLTPDERRDRLAAVTPPPGFTTEWSGGAAVLSTAHNEIARGRADRQRVAVTFDCHHDDQYIDRLLELLRHQQVHATFFLSGQFAGKYPDCVRRIAAAGHEIGNHSHTHPHFQALSDAAVLAEMEAAEKAILPLAGTAYRPYFRPPFGERDVRVLRLLIQHGFLPVYWTVDTLDWQTGATAEAILDRVKKGGTVPGAIVLSHGGSEATMEAVPRMLNLLRGANLQPGTLSALCGPE